MRSTSVDATRGTPLRAVDVGSTHQLDDDLGHHSLGDLFRVIVHKHGLDCGRHILHRRGRAQGSVVT